MKGGKIIEIIIIFVIIGIIGLFIGNFAYHRRTCPGTIKTYDQMVLVIRDAVLDHKTVIKFDSLVSPDELSFDDLFMAVLKEDMYAACEFYSYSYRYTMSGSGYHVKMELNKPLMIKEKLASIRVKQIAKVLNKKLDNDYDKVKAVHDYLITINKYSYFYGGSFNCLYYRSSACNGYANSFYAIMTEMGIPVQFDFDSNHVWNKVKINGEWYYIDVTWDDQEGTVVYDYFLKCDADWNHSGSGVDAKKSLPVTGRSAKDNVRLIPSYRGFGIAAIVILVILLIPLAKLVSKLASQAELNRINKELEEEEKKRLRFERNLERKRQEFNNRDDDFFAL